MKPTATELLDAEIDRLSEAIKLNSWTDFVDALNVPADLFPALMANRPELIKLVKPRPLSVDEHKVYLELIAGILETNRALREHAGRLAQLVSNWTDAFTALRSVGDRIEKFANFKRTNSKDENDD